MSPRVFKVCSVTISFLVPNFVLEIEGNYMGEISNIEWWRYNSGRNVKERFMKLYTELKLKNKTEMFLCHHTVNEKYSVKMVIVYLKV